MMATRHSPPTLNRTVIRLRDLAPGTVRNRALLAVLLARLRLRPLLGLLPWLRLLPLRRCLTALLRTLLALSRGPALNSLRDLLSRPLRSLTPGPLFSSRYRALPRSILTLYPGSLLSSRRPRFSGPLRTRTPLMALSHLLPPLFTVLPALLSSPLAALLLRH